MASQEQEGWLSADTCSSTLISVQGPALPRDRLDSDHARAPRAGNPTHPGTALQICWRKLGKGEATLCCLKRQDTTETQTPHSQLSARTLGISQQSHFPPVSRGGVTGASAPEHSRVEGPHGNVSWNKLETRKRLREQLHSLPVPKGTARELQRDFDKGLE